MTTSTGKTGKGVLFQIAPIASPLVWVTIGNARTISQSGRTADEIDFTHLNSTGGYREFRQGFKDGGTIGVEMHFDPTASSQVGTLGLLGYFDSGTVFQWRINFAANGWLKALTGQGYVANPGDLDINVDGPITGNATVRNTGQVTLAVAP